MPRKLLIKTADYPYHITNRSNNKEFFYLPLPELWDIFLDCFKEASIQFGCEFHAFVLMSNHYHLLVSTPNCNIGEVMKYIQREVAKKANKKAHRINHFFGTRYYWSVVHEENYYWTVVKYIFRNPIRAGICSHVTDYKFSSLNSRTKKVSWQMNDFFYDKTKKISLDLNWLNETYPKEIEEKIKAALRRREFKFPRKKCGNKLEIATPHTKKETVTSKDHTSIEGTLHELIS